MTPLKRTCQQVAALVVAREDRILPLADRLALRLHMVVCETCPQFARQMLTLRNSMQQWRSYTASDPSQDG